MAMVAAIKTPLGYGQTMQLGDVVVWCHRHILGGAQIILGITKPANDAGDYKRK